MTFAVDPIARHQKAVAMLREMEEQDKLLCEKSFIHYFRCVWDILEPRKPMIRGYYQDCIAEHLEAVDLGQINRLIINQPPRTLKSSMVTIAYPTWKWGPRNKPSHRFFAFSYSATLATKHSVDRRTVIESAWYQSYWGKRFHLSEAQNQKTSFSNDQRGHMTATGIRGSATGQGGDDLLIDDPHNPKRADSDQMRETDIQDFQRTVRSRLDNESGAIIVVMQRLHEADLTGHLISEEPGEWTHLKIHGVAEKRIHIDMPKSFPWIREHGDLLLPERLSMEKLRKLRKSMGSYAFSGQIQQEPSDPAGAILKRKWMQKRWATLPARFDRMLISVDLAFKGDDEAKEASQCCFQAWGQKGSEIYMLDCVSDWMEFTVSVTAFQEFCKKWHQIYEKVIENKANGPALMSTLRKKIPGLIPFDPDTDKVSRARSVSPMWEAGDILLPEDAEWVTDFIEQCTVFPKGKLKDRVDTMTQALLRFQMAESGNYDESMKPKAGTTIVGGRKQGEQW